MFCFEIVVTMSVPSKFAAKSPVNIMVAYFHFWTTGKMANGFNDSEHFAKTNTDLSSIVQTEYLIIFLYPSIHLSLFNTF